MVFLYILGFVARRNLRFTLGNIKDLISEGLQSITAAEWEKCERHVLSNERQYWKIDIAVDEVQEPVVLCVGQSESEAESSDSDAAESE